jgi:hypothetical protein
MGELAPSHDSHAVVVGIVHPFIMLYGIWAVLSHAGDVVRAWYCVACQRGADQSDTLP